MFLRDIIERNKVQNDAQLESLLNVISSAVGSLTNPKKLEDTFASSGTGKLSASTICAVSILDTNYREETAGGAPAGECG